MNGTYYKHVLAAIDLSEDNPQGDREGGRPGPRSNGAKLSVIHVDVDLKDLYTEMIDIDIDNVQDPGDRRGEGRSWKPSWPRWTTPSRSW